MKKILIISHSANLYGSEKSLLDYLIHSKSNSSLLFEVWVPSTGPLIDRLKEVGFKVKIFGFKRWINNGKSGAGIFHYLMNMMALIWSAYSFLKFKPDLIYSNSLSNPFGLYLARMYKTKHIWHIREFIEEDIGAQFDFGKINSMRLAGSYTDLFICNSLATSQKWNKYSKKEYRVIYNGFDFDLDRDIKACLEKQANQVVFKLLIASSIQSGKGIQDGINVMLLLKESGLNCTLTIIGSVEDKSYYLKLRQFCEEKGLEDCIKWRGYSNHLIEEFDSHSVLIIPSRCEAFGRIAVEAMAVGLPVIATKAGGLTEIVEDGETGFLYQPEDIVALEACIKKVQGQSELVAKIVEAAHADVIRRFSMSLYIDELTQTFESVLNS
ncbi:MAG: glycosyltransferase involved in cell wall biosynthesis [Candidatus Omnitrophota bacterium]|jgi:glycosyltransferase involved in cell wall biosynthesis